MRTTFIVLAVLALCSIASAQRLEVDGDNFAANTNPIAMIKDFGFTYVQS